MGEIGIAQVVLMGLVTVFVVLICLIIIIKLMGAIMGNGDGCLAYPHPLDQKSMRLKRI